MNTKKLITAALFAALTCAATMVVHIPSGLAGGYVNIGDALVLLSAYVLGPVYGAAAAAIGSCLADILFGYTAYAVPTLVIKFLVALVAGLVFSNVFKSKNRIFMVVCGVLGEAIMVGGYFAAEIFLSGSVAAAAAGVYGNTVQAVFGVAISTVLYKVLTLNTTLKRYMDNI